MWHELSESKQKALLKAQDIFHYGASNDLYVKWREKHIENSLFYEGRNQWPEDILATLRARGQAPIVVNKIKAMVNQVCGLEVNTRHKIAYRSHSADENRELRAKALTHLGFFFQEEQDFSYKDSLKFKDSLIGGVGWTSLVMHKQRMIYDYENSLNIIYDADDFTPQFINQRFNSKFMFLSKDELKTYWPQHRRRFDDLCGDDYSSFGTGSYNSETFFRQNANIDDAYRSGFDGGKIPVVIVQYKQAKRFYRAFNQEGFEFETFDEEEAEELAASKKEIEEDVGTEIMRTVFFQDMLLDHAPLKPHFPNMQDYSFIPFVWSRREDDGVPEAWIEPLKDSQREINYRKAKELAALNSVRAKVNLNDFPGMSLEEVRAEVRRTDAILPESAEIFPNLDISAAQVKASERIDYELQQVSGMFSDSLGDQTNATSGVAIKQRQIGTSRNLASGFDSSSYGKKRVGKKMLELIQGAEFENLEVQVLDNDEREIIDLNVVREINGKKVFFNDIRTIPLDIYIEKVPDYDSSPEEQQATLEALLSNPSAPLILQNPELLKLLRFRSANKIAAAMKTLQQQQAQVEQGANPQVLSPGGDMGDVNPTSLQESAGM